VAVLHTGVVPPHWAFVRHGTQEPVAVKQAGVEPEHFVALVAEHWPHAPLGWQAGAEAGHWVSVAQGWHVCAVVSQIGVVAPQFAFEVQVTHVAPTVSQAGVAPEHLVALVAEHWPQAPLDSQAGVPPGHSESPAHARQVCVVVLQTGWVPLHCALDTQATQVALVVLQTGVAPEHWVVLVAEHCPQAPLDSQAGAEPGHCESVEHAWHV
jgi:hypothetical protein